MSIREVTGYKVVCDEPDCEFSTGDAGGEYSAYSAPKDAVDDWIDDELQVTDDDKHYCHEHRKPTCDGCDTATSPTTKARPPGLPWMR